MEMMTDALPDAAAAGAGDPPASKTTAARHVVRVVFRDAAPSRAPLRRLVAGAVGLAGLVAVALTLVWRPTATAQPRSVPPVMPAAPMAPTHEAPPPKPTPQPAEKTRLAGIPKRLPLPEETRFRVTRRTTSDMAQPVSAGYTAYVRGDADGARTAYEQTLASDPANRQALMGLAALAVRRGEIAGARKYYQRLLDRDPDDMPALSGLLALGPATQAASREAQVKRLLIRHPRAAALHRLLADHYARNERWSEAHRSYAEALALSHGSEPDRGNIPDLAFDLAVSLEHLGRPREAAVWYRQALDELQRNPGGFDPAQAEARLAALSEI